MPTLKGPSSPGSHRSPLTDSFDPAAVKVSYTHRAKRLYLVAWTLRILIFFSSALAVLPDSSIFHMVLPVEIYSLVTTLAGLTLALALVILKGARIVEAMNQANDVVSYLNDKSADLHLVDGLTRKKLLAEMEKEVSDREAKHHRGVSDGLEQLGGRAAGGA